MTSLLMDKVNLALLALIIAKTKSGMAIDKKDALGNEHAPAGSPNGGQFVSKGEGSSVQSKEEPEAQEKTYDDYEKDIKELNELFFSGEMSLTEYAREYSRVYALQNPEEYYGESDDSDNESYEEAESLTDKIDNRQTIEDAPFVSAEELEKKYPQFSFDRIQGTYFDNIFQGEFEKQYMRDNKNIIADVVELSADQYMQLCAMERGKDSSETRAEFNSIDKEKVKKYTKEFKNGTRFSSPPMVQLRTDDNGELIGSQEGRHRIVSYEKAFGKKCPVVIFREAKVENKGQEKIKNSLDNWFSENNIDIRR